mmetsp:Transcript_24239/g.68065  ORF Transcript_24239/g.68065 Transcript_24239/m.68065 type:complete len:80 (-) Transcript_24239:160-399(-)
MRRARRPLPLAAAGMGDVPCFLTLVGMLLAGPATVLVGATASAENRLRPDGHGRGGPALRSDVHIRETWLFSYGGDARQ